MLPSTLVGAAGQWLGWQLMIMAKRPARDLFSRQFEHQTPVTHMTMKQSRNTAAKKHVTLSGKDRASLLALEQDSDHLPDVSVSVLIFAANDATVQKRVDAIQEGTGLADTVDDLTRLAELMSEQATVLKKADLPKNAAARAKELAGLLPMEAASQASDEQASELISLRNRAFWHLRDAMDEIRAAGRYAFRAEPRLVVRFRGTRTPGSRRAKAPVESPA